MIKNNTGLRRISWDRHPDIKHNYKKNLKLWTDNYMRLTEAWHLHEPDIISDYRQILKNITNQISQKLVNGDCIYDNVIINDSIQYTEFIFDEPFVNDSILCCLNKLKIYCGFIDDNEPLGFTIHDNKEDAKIKNKYLSLLEYTSTRPTIVSIFLKLPENNKNSVGRIIDDINSVLPHELKHAMDNAYNKIAISAQSDINEFILDYI